MSSKKKNNQIKIDGDNNYVFQDIENLTIVFDKDFNLKGIDEFKTQSIIETSSGFELKDEVLIYYPYFELETKGLIPKVDHEIYLKSLSLLADRILLPPSHLLDTTPYNINLLKHKFFQFCESDVFITSYRKGQSSISDFIEAKKAGGDLWNDKKEVVAEGVVDLFRHYKKFIKRDVKKQSALFYDFLAEGVFGDSELSFANSDMFSSNQIELLNSEVEKIIDKKGFTISKRDFDNVVLTLGNDEKLNPLQIKKVLDFTNSAYFYSGGLGNTSMVAFSDYFLKSPISGFLNDEDFGTNLFYDPMFFLSLLEATDVIDTKNDIKYLSFDEIMNLRKHSYFKEFLRQYRRFSKICYLHFNNNFLNNKAIEVAVLRRFKKDIKLLDRMRRGVFEVSKNIVVGTTLAHPFNLIMMLPIFLVLGDYEKKVSRKINFEQVLFRITGRIAPLGTFCTAIENMVEKNKYLMN